MSDNKHPKTVNCIKCGGVIGPPDYRFGLWSGTYGLRTDYGWKHFACPEPPEGSPGLTPNMEKLTALADRLNKEPELSLLIVDFGNFTVIKTEKGDGTVRLGGVQYSCPEGSYQTVELHSFADVRAALDGQEAEPPLPRLEYDKKGDLRLILFGGTPNDPTALRIVSGDYLALCQIAGVTIPVWEPKKGAWTRLPSTAEYMGDPLEGVGIQIWRYAR